MFPLVVIVITVLFLIDSFPPIQERYQWLLLVGIRISIAKFDVNYVFNLPIP